MQELLLFQFVIEVAGLSSIREIIPKVFTQAKIAAALGCSQQAVQQWFAKNSVPATRVRALSQLTGVPKERLKPEFFSDFNGD